MRSGCALAERETPLPKAPRLQDFVEAFQAAQDNNSDPDLLGYLPDPHHPLYREVLHALIRVDLEGGWQRKQPRRLVEYQRCFPEAFADPEGVRDLVECEYRLRMQAGESPSLNEYMQAFGTGLNPSDMPQTAVQRVEASHEQRSQVEGHSEGTFSFPDLGTDLLGFEIQEQIGQGAFGKVYLAKQRELGDRQVVLKITTESAGEAHVLAQLLHTNVVPIYSVHRFKGYQAVCMPFLGTTTLSDVLQEVRSQGLPQSGKYLVHTLKEHRSTQRSTRNSDRHSGSSKPRSFPAVTLPEPEQRLSSPSEAEPGTRVILDKLEGLSYIDAVLWLAQRLADGLGHAHDRGILHRDLKPANILLTDEGQPMLLDFNLAEDTKLRTSAEAARMGGTLPYMSPEQLDGFAGNKKTLDPRSDIYSFGVILFELLTGHFPFEHHSGPTKQILPRMLADRRQPPPCLTRWNKEISPAVQAIVRHCLEPDPDRRYQNVRQLQDDLKRQRDHLPLQHIAEPSWRERFRKWRRRHPRLASVTSVGLAAAALVAVLSAALVVHGRQLRHFEAVETLRGFDEDLNRVQFALAAQTTDRTSWEGPLTQGRQALGRYQVVEDPSWRERPQVQCLSADRREQLEDKMRTMLLLVARAAALEARDRMPPGSERAAQLRHALAFNERAEECGAADHMPRALWTQRAELWALLGDTAQAQGHRARVQQVAPRNSQDAYLTAREHVIHGRYQEALPLLRDAARKEPQNVHIWFLLGRCHDGLSQDKEAATCYTTCIALQPRIVQTHFHRGLVHLRQRDYSQARADFDHVLEMEPRNADAFINRALAWRGLKRHKEAIADLNQALALNAPYTRVYFLRSRLRDAAGDKDGAQDDKQEGLKREPKDELSWIARGVAQLTNNPQAALTDFQMALRINPRSRAGLDNSAYVLAELQGKNEEAVALLDKSVNFYPDYVPARAGRGVLLARLGQRDAALKDAEECLKRSSEPAVLYQMATLYATTSKLEPADRREAIRHLTAALRKGYGLELIERDPNFASLRGTPEFRRLADAAKVLR
jgi:serine/threonine protein kinase/tetratricopeptide (TPR) repeat protein